MVRNYYEVVPPEPYSAWNNADKNNCGQYSEGFTGASLKSGNHGCYFYSDAFANNNPAYCATSCDSWGGRTGCNNRWQCSGEGWAYYMVPVTLYKPAGEKVADRPWNGYTPNSDNDHSCNAGLDARINNLLPNLLNDPAVTAAKNACAGAAAASNPEAARECAKFDVLLDARRQERDRLASDQNNNRQPLNSCSCTAGRSSSCRTTGSTYTCQ
jgi:hypothetical protein